MLAKTEQQRQRVANALIDLGQRILMCPEILAPVKISITYEEEAIPRQLMKEHAEELQAILAESLAHATVLYHVPGLDYRIQTWGRSDD